MHVLAGRRPDRRHGCVLAPARGRLHALLAHAGARAFWGTGVGYFVPLVLLFGLGALLALSRGPGGPDGDLHGDRGRRRRERPRAAGAHRGRGGRAVRQRLLGRRLDPEPAAARLPQRLLIVVVAGAATVGALFVDIVAYETFLFLLGSFFVPLFGVLAADFAARGGRARRRALERARRLGWPASRSTSGSSRPARRGGRSSWPDVPGRRRRRPIGASLPAFALAFALYAGVRSAHAPLGRRRARLAGSR